MKIITLLYCILPHSVSSFAPQPGYSVFFFEKTPLRTSTCQHHTSSVVLHVPPIIRRRRHDNNNNFLSSALNLSTSYDNNDAEEVVQKDDLIILASKSLRRASWISWWSQVILTSVSAVTLLFARSVNRAGQNSGGGGFFLAGTGITLSTISILWTFGGRRLARRLERRPVSRIKAAIILRRLVASGLLINLIGMLVTIIGAEQIVGGLAARVLSMQGVTPFGGGVSGAVNGVSSQTVQPLDILIVQANTNTLFSHFVGLLCGVYFNRWIDRLDPPSTDDD